MTDETSPATSDTGPRRTAAGVALLTGAMLLAFVVGLGVTLHFLGRPSAPSQLLPEPADATLPTYQVLDQTGTELSTRDLLDRFVIVDFVFTNCTATCPPLTQQLLRLQDRLGDADDVRIVSFTVDPKRDSPEVLDAYARKVGADPKRWSFLFTNVGTVHDIAFNGLKMGHPTEVMAHSNDFALLDRHGRVRAYYHPLDDPNWVESCLVDLDLLRDEPEVER